MNKFILVFMFLTFQLFSTLAPLPQSIREIEAILMNPQLIEKIPSGEKIDQIIRIEQGYLIITKAKTLKVSVIYDQSPRIGPLKFTLEFSDAKSLKD